MRLDELKEIKSPISSICFQNRFMAKHLYSVFQRRIQKIKKDFIDDGLHFH